MPAPLAAKIFSDSTHCDRQGRQRQIKFHFYTLKNTAGLEAFVQMVLQSLNSPRLRAGPFMVPCRFACPEYESQEPLYILWIPHRPLWLISLLTPPGGHCKNCRWSLRSILGTISNNLASNWICNTLIIQNILICQGTVRSTSLSFTNY